MTSPRRGWRLDDWLRPHQHGRYPTGRMRPARTTRTRWWNRQPTTTRGVLLLALLIAVAISAVLLAVGADRSYVISYVVAFTLLHTVMSLRRLRKQRAGASPSARPTAPAGADPQTHR